MHCDHEYLNFKGGKFSKSRGAAVEVPYFLSKYDPDALREPAPLFKKLDESVIEEEYAQLEGRTCIKRWQEVTSQWA